MISDIEELNKQLKDFKYRDYIDELIEFDKLGNIVGPSKYWDNLFIYYKSIANIHRYKVNPDTIKDESVLSDVYELNDKEHVIAQYAVFDVLEHDNKPTEMLLNAVNGKYRLIIEGLILKIRYSFEISGYSDAIAKLYVDYLTQYIQEHSEDNNDRYSKVFIIEKLLSNWKDIYFYNGDMLKIIIEMLFGDDDNEFKLNVHKLINTMSRNKDNSYVSDQFLKYCTIAKSDSKDANDLEEYVNMDFNINTDISFYEKSINNLIDSQ
jgi:hypothetical protein